MRLLRCVEPDVAVREAGAAGRDVVDTRRRQQVAEGIGIARCPRCDGVLVLRMAGGRPAFWCRCPVRRGLVA